MQNLLISNNNVHMQFVKGSNVSSPICSVNDVNTKELTAKPSKKQSRNTKEK
ncbi:hypothetical protein ACA350_04665 [Orientia tsutsugamushi]|uniref:hypothetical protein n=1 Tax=Orientia tsutsugamushi TaxID=784 RepID=UPI003528BABB